MRKKGEMVREEKEREREIKAGIEERKRVLGIKKLLLIM